MTPRRHGAWRATALPPAERRRLAPLAAAVARASAPGPPRLEPVVDALAGLAGAGPAASAGRSGLLAGTFNPLTRAHAALALAGRRHGCDRVVLAMAPVSLDKERLERAHPLDRLDWVARWARRRRWAAVAVASHPLLVDMAEALGRQAGGEVALLVGADKARQLADPRYYDDLGAALGRLASAATLLVAERAGHSPEGLPLTVTPLRTPGWAPERSATQARAAAAAGLPLGELVPAVVAAGVRRTHAYDPGPAAQAAYAARARGLDALVEAARRAP